MTLAYLDPGSGSLIASALVGGVAAAGVAAKQARARFSGFGRKRKQETEFSSGTEADVAEGETSGSEASTADTAEVVATPDTASSARSDT